jgi:ATPase subunit of ABC transporter with duplicated ATPase domains
VTAVESGAKSNAMSEQAAMALLSRFQFPSKRWYDRVGQMSGGERRRYQIFFSKT